MTAALDLTPFTNADTLTWEQITVFAPHRGDDGTLITDTGYRLPLDVFTAANSCADWPPLSDGLGIVVVEDPTTIDDTREAVRAWCRAQLGRDDVTFE